MTKNNPVLHKNDLRIKVNNRLKNNCLVTASFLQKLPLGMHLIKLEATNYKVEDAYAISGENSSEQGAIKKLMHSQAKPILHQLL
jgi:hypothetical protein